MKYNFDMIQNGYTVCRRGWGMKDECAIFHRIYYVYGGEAYSEYNGEITPLEAGSLYLFPVMRNYTLWHNPEKPLDVLWFHIEMKIPACMELEQVEIEKGTILEYLLEAMKQMSNTPEYYEELLGTFTIFWRFLVEKLPMGQYIGRRMKKILEYIDDNISEPELGVQSLADHIGMDRAYFSRKFKKTFNISPAQYIYAKKMSVAAMQLMAGASIYQSAMSVGYLDEKAFSRAFKKYMEVSPGQYRKSHNVQP